MLYISCKLCVMCYVVSYVFRIEIFFLKVIYFVILNVLLKFDCDKWNINVINIYKVYKVWEKKFYVYNVFFF